MSACDFPYLQGCRSHSFWCLGFRNNCVFDQSLFLFILLWPQLFVWFGHVYCFILTRDSKTSCVLSPTEQMSHVPYVSSVSSLCHLWVTSCFVPCVWYLLPSSYHSQENFLTPTVFGEIIYENFLFDIPKILDLCVLFGKGNTQLLHKMIGRLLALASWRFHIKSSSPIYDHWRNRIVEDTGCKCSRNPRCA